MYWLCPKVITLKKKSFFSLPEEKMRCLNHHSNLLLYRGSLYIYFACCLCFQFFFHMVSWNPIPKKLEALIKKKYKKAINNQYAFLFQTKITINH